jgi:hypothetical protein
MKKIDRVTKICLSVQNPWKVQFTCEFGNLRIIEHISYRHVSPSEILFALLVVVVF